MAERTAIYTLGRKGVNLVDDPLILDDGSFTIGQNAQTSPDEAEGSILKRAGMGMLLIPPSATPVLAILSLPFADPSPGSSHYGYPPWRVPAAPSNLASGSKTSSAITFTWDAVPGATGYRVDVATDAGFTNMVENNVADADTTHTVSGLDPQTEYHIRVRAENQKGASGNSDPITMTTNQAPTGGTFVAVLVGVPTCEWTVLSGTPVNGKIRCGITDQQVIFDFGSGYTPIIYLDGDYGTPLGIGDLPAGFQVATADTTCVFYNTYAGGWNEVDFGTIDWAGNTGVAFGAGWYTGGSLTLHAQIVPCDMATLLSYLLIVTANALVAGGIVDMETDVAAPYIVGTYEIV